MIVEIAEMAVVPGREAGFEEALVTARAELEASPGFRSLQVTRGVERPSVYRLLITWERLEDHTEGFRGSERFTRWRAVLGPFFDGPPAADHWVPTELPG